MKLIITNQAQKDLSKLDKATQRRVQIAWIECYYHRKMRTLKNLKEKLTFGGCELEIIELSCV
ncbi:hypothetical protein P378_13645 [Desulforamulus profundi]|uniref:Uncharacterized protein n=1 Tax=Desulforamulus profundi TaxID=1383067 RepID=A0A2C6M9K1_9FIRM|nr:hypothetical protein [Desulforamulus profundi]PHJ37819.1 hypothetical protein P378_13645 [Desulforamulus profundi]